MANVVYPKGVQGFLRGEIDADTAVLKAIAVKGYTYSSSHTTVSDVTGGGGGTILSTSSALASVTTTDGVLDVDDFTFSSVATDATGIQSIIIIQSSAVTGGADVAAGSQRLIAHYDGIVSVTCAKAASTSDTTVYVDRVDAAIANGSTVVFGGVTATLTGAASANDRTLTVSALSGPISAGTAGLSSRQGNLPIPTNGGNINVTVGSTSGILLLTI